MKHLAIAILIFAIAGCSADPADQKEKQADEFIQKHVVKVKPMLKEAGLAYWKAANTGDPNDYDKVSELHLKISEIYTNPQEFALVKEFKNSVKSKDLKLTRQIDGLYNAYLSNQIDPKLLKQIIDLGTEIEKNFTTFRGTVDGEKVTTNEIKEMLKTETDSEKRKKAWLASKQVAPVVAKDLIRLIKLRNQAARKVGFENYHTLSLTVSEQDVKEITRIFNELYELTNEPFAELKAELDGILAEKYDITAAEIKPWHYHDPFFQEVPLVYELDLDTYYEGKDVKDLSVEFFTGIGLPVESILDDSDLYERDGKNPHAFCTDIDREGDVRILCNIKNNDQWMETMLHELGHAVYSKNHNPNLPFFLRDSAHIFTTEAIAMFFGRLPKNAAWMQQMLDLSDRQHQELESVTRKYAQLKQLIFARWDMVMFEFEKQLYADPDQDLDNLWWQIVEKYQFIKRPKGRTGPDWASKIHFTIAPCYYHNYLLGELLASQLHNHLVHNVLKLKSDKNVSYVNQTGAGDFLCEKVFKPGSLYHWNEMIERATGEPLTPKYFVTEFVK